MLALAGYQLGIEFRFFDPNAGAPVGQIGELIAADYSDQAALERFLEGVDVVTYEFESRPYEIVCCQFKESVRSSDSLLR